MSARGLLLLLVLTAYPAFADKAVQSFARAELGGAAAGGPSCSSKWFTETNNLLFVDETHLAVLRLQYCADLKLAKQSTSYELAIVDFAGHVEAIRNDTIYSALRGPHGTILESSGKQIDLLDLKLHSRQSILCPPVDGLCNAYTSPSGKADSDFAICSFTDHKERCHFYQGLPAEELSEQERSFPVIDGFPHNPYPEPAMVPPNIISPWNQRAWQVTPSEAWYYDKENILTSGNANGQIAAVTQQIWADKATNCTGEPSRSTPARFLALCIGTRFYTDGDLDFLFGYSRIALFDVTSRSILARINGRAYTWAALSPEGKVIAVLHEDQIRFYRVEQ